MPFSVEGVRALEGSGEGVPALLRSLDYPCTARLLLHRLLAYNRRYNYETIYSEARGNKTVTFVTRDVMTLVKRGMWRMASNYILGFLPADPMSDELNLLLRFLGDLMVLNDFADGNTTVACQSAPWYVKIYYNKPLLAAYPCFGTLVADVLFLRSDHARSFLKWQLVRNKAAEMVQEMAYATPELKDKLHFPRGRNDLYHVVHIGSSFRPRRLVKTKNLGRQQPIHLAQFYLQLKKRFPSSGPGGSDIFSAGSASLRLRGGSYIAVLEKALQAGCHLLLEQGHLPEYPPEEGFPYMQLLTRPPFLGGLASQMLQAQHSSKQAMTSTETNSEKTLQTGKPPLLEQGQPPECPSKEGFPLQQMQASPPFLPPVRSQVHQPEHSSKQAIKRPSFHFPGVSS